MGKVIPVESVSHWNSTLRAAKEKNQPIFVDFFATWCGPCKVISPVFEQLASQYPNAVFLKVDVDRLQAIAAKYQITAMPTFYAIRESGPVDSIRGADSQGLAAMVAKHATAPPAPPLPAEAEAAKAEGNTAFAEGDYARAVECYSRAIESAPKSAVLLANRAFANIKIIKTHGVPKEERKKLRVKVVQDALTATSVDAQYAKGWVRMAEALLLSMDEEAIEDIAPEARHEGSKKALEGAQEALQNAIGLAEGKVKVEAQKMLEEVESQLRSM